MTHRKPEVWFLDGESQSDDPRLETQISTSDDGSEVAVGDNKLRIPFHEFLMQEIDRHHKTTSDGSANDEIRWTTKECD